MFVRKNPLWLALPLLVASTMLVLGSLLLDLLQGLEHERRTGQQRLAHLTEQVAEHTARSLEAVDILLKELASDLSGDDAWMRWDARTGYDYLATRHSRSLPQVRDLIIFDRHGEQRFISTQFPATSINVRDRPYFEALARGADFAMYGPYVGRNSGRYTYALARSIKDRQQRFAGAVFAAIEPAYFQDFCWSIRMSDDFEAVLINTQGRIVASCRPADLSRHSPLLGAHAHDVLAAGALKRLDGDVKQDWLVAQTNVNGFPDLRVLSLVPEHAVLEQSYRRLTDYVILASLVVLLMLGGGWLLHLYGRRASLRLQSQEAQLHALERQLRAADQQLERQRQEAERANAAKSRFLAAASHDLRQPLHALALFAADLQRQVRLGNIEALPQLSQQIQASTEVISELLDSLLDLSRLDVAGISPVLTDHPLAAVFDRLATSFGRAALAKNLRLRFRNPELWVFTDANLLERMLANLISNAIRYTEQGGILVSARPRGEQVLIQVWDTGIGIAREHQQAIFVEFYQIDNAARESHKGLGLGLSIVDRLARALGLKLELRSQPGRGTCFSFLLPRSATQPDETDAAASQHSPGTHVPIRIIGESEAIAQVRTLLRAWGYPVANAAHVPSDAPGIVISTTAFAAAARPLLAPGSIQIVLGQEHDGRTPPPPGLHYLGLPLRPARLRALLRRLEAELKA
ncbi:MAG: ATP-binding protein [Azovibrio sp.]|nr:ATP-binding protein [Azovibrio sp.]